MRLTWVSLLLAPSILLILVVTLIPLFFSFYLSLTDCTLFMGEFDFVGLANYARVLSDPQFHEATIRTVIYAFSVTMLSFLLGLFTSLFLNQKIKGNQIISSLLLCPYLIPSVAAAHIFMWILNPIYGPFPYFLSTIGLIKGYMEFFSSLSLALPAVILASSWRYFPFMTLVLLARLQIISKELYEAALVDGASTLQRFLYITLPQIRSVILFAFLLRFIFMFNEFDMIWILTGGGPVSVTTTIPILAWMLTFKGYQLNLGAVCVFVSLLFLAILSVFYFRTAKLGV